MGSVGTNIFGNSANDKLTVTIDDVTDINLIDDAKWQAILNRVNTERSRRNGSTGHTLDFTGEVTAGNINALKNLTELVPPALGTSGFLDRFGYQTSSYYRNSSNAVVYFSQATNPSGWFTGVTIGQEVTAVNLNAMIDKIQGASAMCVCNCNYCTCNCNYCTCNCNYACTCNCNYSDKRLKRNIKFLREENGINIYSYNYRWSNKTIEGVMAQEIIGTQHNEAVILQKNGFYKVDYSKLPITAKGY